MSEGSVSHGLFFNKWYRQAIIMYVIGNQRGELGMNVDTTFLFQNTELTLEERVIDLVSGIVWKAVLIQ